MEPEEDLQSNFGWNLCIICQETTNERLQCPAFETHGPKDIGSGYVTPTENLQAFSELGMDTPVIKSFKNVKTLLACLLENQGKWDKSCHLRFNSTKLQRLTKLTRENQYEGQMFSPGQKKFLKNVSLIVVMNLINRLYTQSPHSVLMVE